MKSYDRLYRTGYTEGSLLICDQFLQLDIPAEVKTGFLFEQKRNLGWLYTTAGIYDDDNKLSDMFDYRDLIKQPESTWYNKILKSDTYNKWLKNYKESCEQSTFTHINTHHYINKVLAQTGNLELWDKFKITKNIQLSTIPRTKDTVVKRSENSDKYHNFWCNNKLIYSYIRDKNVMIVNNLGSLCVQQYTTNNIFKANNNFPRVRSITSYDTPCCFFGTGPDKNSVHTLDMIANEIVKVPNIDTYIISCGAMALPLSNKIYKHNKSNILCIGSNLLKIFCIDLTTDRKNGYITELPSRYIKDNCRFKPIEHGKYFGK